MPAHGPLRDGSGGAVPADEEQAERAARRPRGRPTCGSRAVGPRPLSAGGGARGRPPGRGRQAASPGRRRHPLPRSPRMTSLRLGRPRRSHLRAGSARAAPPPRASGGPSGPIPPRAAWPGLSITAGRPRARRSPEEEPGAEIGIPQRVGFLLAGHRFHTARRSAPPRAAPARRRQHTTPGDFPPRQPPPLCRRSVLFPGQPALPPRPSSSPPRRTPPVGPAPRAQAAAGSYRRQRGEGAD